MLLALEVPSLQCDLRYKQKLTDPEKYSDSKMQKIFTLSLTISTILKYLYEDVHLVVGRMHRQDVRSVWAQSTSHYLDLQFQNNSFIVKSLNLRNYLDLKFQNNFLLSRVWTSAFRDQFEAISSWVPFTTWKTWKIKSEQKNKIDLKVRPR